jgi:replicative DNA helicase
MQMQAGGVMISESESILLDACFREPDSLPAILDAVQPEDFNYNAYSKTFTAIRALFQEGHPIDPLAVARRAGIPSDSFPWTGDHCLGMNIDYHAQQVRQQGQRRRLRLALKAAVDVVQDESRELAEIQEHISDSLFKTLANTQQRHDRDIAGDVLQFYEQRKQERAQGKRHAGIETGITAIDNVLGGLQPGTLTIIGGRSSHGKSTLVLDFFFRAGKAGTPGLYISLEQTAQEIFLYLLQKYTGISPLTVKLGSVNQAQEIIVKDAIKRLGESPFYFEDSSSRLTDIALKIKAAALGKKIKLVVVDYIQLIENSVKGEARHIEVAGISRMLKRLAMDLNIAVVALSQLNKESEGRAKNKIYLSDCRESEAISHDADTVIFLNRPSLYGDDGCDYIELAKNRHGQTIPKIKVRWDHKYNVYNEILSQG